MQQLEGSILLKSKHVIYSLVHKKTATQTPLSIKNAKKGEETGNRLFPFFLFSLLSLVR